jgi:hypothetical protein
MALWLDAQRLVRKVQANGVDQISVHRKQRFDCCIEFDTFFRGEAGLTRVDANNGFRGFIRVIQQISSKHVPKPAPQSATSRLGEIGNSSVCMHRILHFKQVTHFIRLSKDYTVFCLVSLILIDFFATYLNSVYD